MVKDAAERERQEVDRMYMPPGEAAKPRSRKAKTAKALALPHVSSSISEYAAAIDYLLANRKRLEAAARRFWVLVDQSAGPKACWPFTGCIRGGYGRFTVSSGFAVGAHRVAYVLGKGEALGELHCCHRCDNPPCCNPDHLFAGTNADNVADKMAKGRLPPSRPQDGERNGAAKMTDAQVATIRRRIQGGETNTKIAADYGVTHQAISRIRRGRSWGDQAMQPKYASLRSPPRPTVEGMGG